jgi:hypothetical protein
MNGSVVGDANEYSPAALVSSPTSLALASSGMRVGKLYGFGSMIFEKLRRNASEKSLLQLTAFNKPAGPRLSIWREQITRSETLTIRITIQPPSRPWDKLRTLHDPPFPHNQTTSFRRRPVRSESRACRPGGASNASAEKNGKSSRVYRRSLTAKMGRIRWSARESVGAFTTKAVSLLCARVGRKRGK